MAKRFSIKAFENQISQLSKDELIAMLVTMKKEQEVMNRAILDDTDVKDIICPKCSTIGQCERYGYSTHTDRIPRFRCRACGKTFTSFLDDNDLMINSKHTIATWKKFCHLIVTKHSTCREIAKECSVDKNTAYHWRLKLCNLLIDKFMGNIEYHGEIIETDETYFAISFKGSGNQGKMGRNSHQRGEPATQRGLSKDQSCISAVTDRSDNRVASLAGFGKISAKRMESAIGEFIKEDNYILSDGESASKKLAANHSSMQQTVRTNKKHKVLNANKMEHINTVNAFHSVIKKRLNFDLHGVSTKNINSYLALVAFEMYDGMSDEEKEKYLLGLIMQYNVNGGNYTYKAVDRGRLSDTERQSLHYDDEGWLI